MTPPWTARTADGAAPGAAVDDGGPAGPCAGAGASRTDAAQQIVDSYAFAAGQVFGAQFELVEVARDEPTAAASSSWVA